MHGCFRMRPDCLRTLLQMRGKYVSAGAEVIYMGWIMAGSVKGYAAAARQRRS